MKTESPIILKGARTATDLLESNLRQRIRSLLASEAERQKTILDALPAAAAAIAQLVRSCEARTRQSYKVRALLYSLWNGKPASLRDITTLDYDLREALLAVLTVLRVFGSEGLSYDGVFDAFDNAGLGDWFLEEGSTVQCRGNNMGQSYNLRTFLYSLWSGKPTPLFDFASLDHGLREPLLALLGVFGCWGAFPDAIFNAFRAAGLGDWFLEEGETRMAATEATTSSLPAEFFHRQ